MGSRHKPKKYHRVECPYCGSVCCRVSGDVIYPHRPDLRKKLFYQCEPCDAYVGTHQKSGEPLGLPANRELRHARMRAHAAFDPVWRSGRMRRDLAYLWLSDQLSVKPKDTHIGMFNVEQCQRVIDAVASLKTISVKYQGEKHDSRGNGGLDGSDREPGAAGAGGD